MLLTIYCLDLVLTSGLELGGALAADRAGAALTPRVARGMAVRSVLWFLCLPEIVDRIRKGRRA